MVVPTLRIVSNACTTSHPSVPRSLNQVCLGKAGLEERKKNSLSISEDKEQASKDGKDPVPELKKPDTPPKHETVPNSKVETGVPKHDGVPAHKPDSKLEGHKQDAHFKHDGHKFDGHAKYDKHRVGKSLSSGGGKDSRGPPRQGGRKVERTDSSNTQATK